MVCSICGEAGHNCRKCPSKKAPFAKVKDLESKLLAVTLRAEKADIKASTARNEMIDVTKKYAKEISSLKARLAEKEAQLMGGFGSLSKLALGEMSQAGGSLHARPARGRGPVRAGAPWNLCRPSRSHKRSSQFAFLN